MVKQYVGKEERSACWVFISGLPHQQALFKVGTDHLNDDVGSIITLLGKGR